MPGQGILAAGLLWLLCQVALVTAATELSISAVVSSRPSAPSQTLSSIVTSFSSQYGPYLSHEEYCWSKRYNSTVMGTVAVTVDQIHNTTISRTVYNTGIIDASRSGSLGIFTRSDVNSDGTVTREVVGEKTINGSVSGGSFEYTTPIETLTYPTNWNSLDAVLTWNVIGATFQDGKSCCSPTNTYKPTPFRTTAAPPPPSLDIEDPKGLLYELEHCPYASDLFEPTYPPSKVSSIFGNASLAIDYNGCPYTICPHLSSYSSAALDTVQGVVGVFATSTTTLSSVDALTTSHTAAQAELLSSTPTPAKTSIASSATLTKTTVQTSSTSSSTSTDSSTSTSRTAAQPSPASSAVSTTPGSQQSPASVASNFNDVSISPASQSSAADSHDAQSSLATQSTKNQDTQSNSPSTLSAGQASVPSALPSITIGSSTIAPNSESKYVIGSLTLQPGSSISISGSIINYPATAASTLPVITAGSIVATANSASEYVIASQTLRPGSSISVSGSVINYPSASTPASLPLISFGASIITPVSSKYLFGTQTLEPGSAIVVSGTTISLASGATQIVVGGITSALVSTSSTGPGGYIYSAIANQSPSTSASVSTGNSDNSTTSAQPSTYSGVAHQVRLLDSFWSLPLFVAMLVSDLL